MPDAELGECSCLESRMLGNQHIRFGGGRREKEQAIATSLAVYPTGKSLVVWV